MNKHEAMARAYCEMMGIDADEHDNHIGPRWSEYVDEARRQEAWFKIMAKMTDHDT
jgi:hypothetical protein